MQKLSLGVTGILCFVATTTTVSASLIEYTAGHADVRPVYENGELALQYRFDSNAILDGVSNPAPSLVDPEDAYVRVADSTIADPADSALLLSFFPDFFVDIGSPTDPYWNLPQSNVHGEPFFGFSTEELVPSDWGPSFDFELTAFSGPGHFTLFQDGFGPDVKFSTADNHDSFSFVQGHDHFNWLFLEAGVYELGFTVTGTHVTDGIKTGSGTFLFAVGDTTVIPEPHSLAVLGLGSLLLVKRRRHTEGH